MGTVNNMKTFFLVILFTLHSAIALSATAPKKAVPPPGPEKRLYTEEEFKKASMLEAEKIMKKAGSAHLIEFSKELLDKEEALKVKELNLQRQEEQLKLNTADFQKKLVEFQDSQKKFLGCIDSQNDKAEKRIAQMVEVISGMKPQSAADVLSVQDPDLSVRIMGQLEPAKASKIFNLMDKEVSARLQKQFLQMKK
jgi:flagellar motility protein MotE (MotC chaperone)